MPKFKSVTREVVDRQTSEIAGLTDAAQRGESAQRSMEAQQRVLCEAEGRTGRILIFIYLRTSIFITFQKSLKIITHMIFSQFAIGGDLWRLFSLKFSLGAIHSILHTLLYWFMG